MATLLLLAALPRPASVAEMTGELQIREYKNAVFDYRTRSVALEDVLITHNDDVSVRAARALQTVLAGNVNQLELSGGVHIDFREATLEADSAVMLFRGDRFLSVKVEGSQAQFSHQPADYPHRIHGRADSIRYETASGQVVFSGNTSYTDGCNRLEASSQITYDINSGIVRDDGDPATRGKTVICLDRDDERVPTPRPPDRSTAQ